MTEPTQAKPGRDKLRWVFGWFVIPATLIGSLFLAGVHVGARRPDQPLARTLLKLTDTKPGVAESSEPTRTPPRPGAKPGEPFRYDDTLDSGQLQAIADKSLGLSVAELDCESVCRALSKSKVDSPIYAVEHCELRRTVSAGPVVLSCDGTFEAVERQPAKPAPEPG